MKVEQLYEQHGIGLDALQARFYGIPLDWKGWAFEQVKDYLSSRRRFPVFDLSPGVLDSWVKRFRRQAFDYLYGYTSSMAYFARYLLDKGIVLKRLCPSLKVCIVTSELCTPEDRQVLQQGFGIPVRQRIRRFRAQHYRLRKPDGSLGLIGQPHFSGGRRQRWAPLTLWAGRASAVYGPVQPRYAAYPL
ncbi:MAG: hypothetical protein H6564_20890 [Lewinellaceae bacterium]|nr:hypothetical protein [Lewinellaceae bacterium]